MSAPLVTLLPTDTRWPGPWHVEAGPDCLCSRCGRAILAHDIAVRAWPADDPNRYSYRFHPACLGLQSVPPLDDDDGPIGTCPECDHAIDVTDGLTCGQCGARWRETETYDVESPLDEEMPGMVIWPREETP